MNGTRGIAAVLTCLAWVSTAAAQTPDDARTRRELRAQAQAEAQARKRAELPARGRLGAARGLRGGQSEASETFTRTVQLERGSTLDLQNVAGDITITGGSGREAKIEVVKRVRAVNDGRAQLLLSQIRVDIAERGGNVEVRTTHPAGPRPGQARVDYVVTVPTNTNIMLHSTSGDLRVQNISGDELNVTTLQGNVTVSDLQTRLLELQTVSGDLLLRGVAAQRAFVQSTRGNLEYAGPFQRAGQYRLQAHNGNIRVIPSGEPGFDLEAMTHTGQLRSDFVLKLLQQSKGPRGLNAKVLRGTFGDARAMLTASTFNGDVVIVKPEGSQ
jgi:DUF4097 and DUF4098 domain-containing protein YvlB